MAKNDLPTPFTTTIPELPKGWFPLSYTALAGNRLGIIGVDKAHDSARSLSPSTPAKIWTFDGEALYENISFPLLFPFPIIDEFPDGTWLVANARSRGQGNTRIIRPDGIEARRIELGDALNHIKIDAESRIWVGWFDEGIFGNDNWQYQELKWPPSSYGIAAFDSYGTLLEHANLQTIADCYALNAFKSEAWACPYTDFPIWQMHDSQERIWPSELSGIKALAIGYPFALAAGGYGENLNSISLVELNANNASIKMTWKTPLIPTDKRIELLDGRENLLHLVTGNKWHRWEVSQFSPYFYSAT